MPRHDESLLVQKADVHRWGHDAQELSQLRPPISPHRALRPPVGLDKARI